MWLSRLILNPDNRHAHRQFYRPRELHQAVLLAFPQGGVEMARDAAGASGVLFRIEEWRREWQYRLMVQSQVEPDWSVLGERFDDRHTYLLPARLVGNGGENPGVLDVDQTPLLQRGRVLSFRLRANPTVKKDREGKEQGHRIALKEEAQQCAWLDRQAARNGFEVLDVRTTRPPRAPKREREEVEGDPLKVYAVQFDGLLRVTDPEALAAAMRAGIGPGKAWGCGLLSLAPPR